MIQKLRKQASLTTCSGKEAKIRAHCFGDLHFSDVQKSVLDIHLANVALSKHSTSFQSKFETFSFQLCIAGGDIFNMKVNL